MFNFSTDSSSYTMSESPLVRAVAQVVFPPALHLATPTGLAELQDKMDDVGFQLQPEAPVGFQIAINVGNGPLQRVLFRDQDGYEVAVTPQTATLSIDEGYRSRDHFQTHLESVLGATGKVGKMRECSRFGVRYINALPCDAEKFAEWFRPEFTGWGRASFVAADTAKTWVSTTQLNDWSESVPANAGTIRYGYLTDGVGADVTSSAAATQPSFLADIDLASMRTVAYDIGELGNLYRKINHEIAGLFEYSLTDEGRSKFGLRQGDAK